MLEPPPSQKDPNDNESLLGVEKESPVQLINEDTIDKYYKFRQPVSSPTFCSFNLLIM